MDIYHILLTHASVGGHLGGFDFLAVVSSAVKNVCTFTNLSTCFHFFGLYT